MKYEKEFFCFAMASGIAEAEARAIKKSEKKADLMQRVVHDLLAEWGLMEDYLDFATETTGIEAKPYFEDYLERNAEKKVELTKEVLFETALEKNMFLLSLNFEEELRKQDGYEEVKQYVKATVEALDLFINAEGIEEDYSNFICNKTIELLKKSC